LVAAPLTAIDSVRALADVPKYTWYPESVTGVPSVLAVGGVHESVAVPLRGVVAGVTVTVALWLAEPAEPVQLSVYVVVALSAAVDCEPLVATLPDQPPEAVQVVALLVVQVNSDVPPVLMLEGLALRDTLGGAAATEIVADWEAEPPVPLQVSVNLVAALKATVVYEPRVGFVPVQPFEAVQAVALVEDQVSVDDAPLLTVLGLAFMVTAGFGVLTVTVADCAALPPGPVHVSE